MTGRKKDIQLYLLSDFIATLITWILFFSFRKIYIEELDFKKSFLTNDTNFYLGLIFISTFWCLFFFISNTYTDIYKKSRLNEIGKTIFQTFIGSFFLFFLIMLNDKIRNYQDYYFIYLFYVGVHLLTLLIGRLAVLNYAKTKIRNHEVSINTLLIGKPAQREIIKTKLSNNISYLSKQILSYQIKKETNFEDAPILINNTLFEEVIIAENQYGQKNIELLIIECLAKGIGINILVNDFDILSGKYKTQSIFDTDFIHISPTILSPLQRATKRLFDIVVSIVTLFFLSPFMLLIAFLIKKSSSGNIIYKQERIGKNGMPFVIFKFRSMIENAESHTPQLTQDNDQRITKIGQIIRKYRIDELPQLYNVLIGDMSIVGPRPERRFFIDEILKTTPKYQLLQRIKPGVTSLGMVKFGYARNISEMIQRMRYDILYIENISISLDLKILFYTISTVIKGKGK